jgi:truncated hemoglobin YjbI
MVETTQTLYEALGSEVGIRTVVADFYDRVVSDPNLASYFTSVDMSGLRRHQVQFLSSATGGPRQYSGPTLADAHQHLNITDEAFDAVVVHLIQSLVEAGATQPAIDQVVAALAPLRSDVVTSS